MLFNNSVGIECYVTLIKHTCAFPWLLVRYYLLYVTYLIFLEAAIGHSWPCLATVAVIPSNPVCSECVGVHGLCISSIWVRSNWTGSRRPEWGDVHCFLIRCWDPISRFLFWKNYIHWMKSVILFCNVLCNPGLRESTQTKCSHSVPAFAVIKFGFWSRRLRSSASTKKLWQQAKLLI